MWSRRTLLAAGTLALAHNAGADPAEPAPARVGQGATTLAVEISGYPLVFVWLRIDGRQVRALIDTGSASPVRLSSRLAQDLKLPLEPVAGSTVQGLDGRRLTVQRGMVDTLEMGNSIDRAVEIDVAGDRIESVAAQVGTTFDVVLGWGFLSRRDFVLDYRQHQLHFGGRLQGPGTTGVGFGYTIVNRLPVVPARWGTQGITLLFDTGAPMCNIDAAFANTPPGQVIARDVMLGTTQLSLQWRAKDLGVTRKALGTVGTLGNNLFGRYAVVVDTRKQRILLD